MMSMRRRTATMEEIHRAAARTGLKILSRILIPFRLIDYTAPPIL